jgi:nitrite reductase/ring-hydroxylating ferredoxin subunit
MAATNRVPARILSRDIHSETGTSRMSQPLCSLAELTERGVLAVDARIDGREESLLLVQRDGRVAAFLNICPHAGRRLDWAPGKFLLENGRLVCAAHGASFDLPGGECVGGPCRGQSLSAVKVRLQDSMVVFDAS